MTPLLRGLCQDELWWSVLARHASVLGIRSLAGITGKSFSLGSALCPRRLELVLDALGRAASPHRATAAGRAEEPDLGLGVDDLGAAHPRGRRLASLPQSPASGQLHRLVYEDWQKAVMLYLLPHRATQPTSITSNPRLAYTQPAARYDC